MGRFNWNRWLRRMVDCTPGAPAVRRGASPRLELLEDRTVPSIWVGGSLDVHGQYTGGDPTAWGNPLNWQGPVPGAGDTASFTANVTESYIDQNGNAFTHNGPQDFTSNVD